MKLFHIGDLHIGRYLHKYNLADCQREVLRQIVEMAGQERPDALLIAGDVFDKSIPSGEAYTIFDQFLEKVTAAAPDMTVLLIAGNHDSAERLQYASSFLERHHIYISVLPPSLPEEHLKKVTLTDAYGEVDFYLLPFTRPSYVRRLFDEGESAGISWSDAVAKVLEREQIDFGRRNVILSHQFYASEGAEPETCDSEQTSIAVGGIDRVDVDLLKSFDYAALGHLHGSQQVKFPYVRYAGTPFKYSVSEAHQKKSVTQIVLGEKGSEPEITFLPIAAEVDVRSIRGRLQEVLELAERDDLDVDEHTADAADSPEDNEQPVCPDKTDSDAEKRVHVKRKQKGEMLPQREKCQDYVSIILTDEDDGLLTDARDQLEERYAHILELRVDNQRTRAQFEDQELAQEGWSLSEAFSHFFEEMNQRSMNEQESLVMEQLWKEMGGLV